MPNYKPAQAYNGDAGHDPQEAFAAPKRLARRDFDDDVRAHVYQSVIAALGDHDPDRAAAWA